MMYRLRNNLAPQYLNLCPELTSTRTNCNIRSSSNLSLPLVRAESLKKSFIPSSIKLWNDLLEEVHCSPTLSAFKKDTCRWIGNLKRNYLYFILLIFLLKAAFSPSCACGNPKETVKHLFFYCNQYAAPRPKLLTSAAHPLGFKWLQASISLKLTDFKGHTKHRISTKRFKRNIHIVCFN